MNFNNLSEGMIFKNYKELCNALEIEVAQGNTKKKQLKDLSTYCNLIKEGHSIIIKEIYSTPKQKKDKRTENIYSQYIEKLILDLLVYRQEQDNQSTLNLSPNKLFEYLNMINKNYSYCLENKQKLAMYLNMDKEYIKDFYNNTYPKLKQTLETALKRLSNKSLIFWSTVITIVRDDYDCTESHKVANKEEVQRIISVEKEVLNSMGFKTKSEVILKEKIKEYNKLIINILQQENENIKYYYRSYQIIFNNFVKQEQKRLESLLLWEEKENFPLELERKTILQKTLNETIVSNYKKSNVLRYKANLKKIVEPEYNSQRIKISEDYIKNNDILINTTISNKTKDITNDIYNNFIQEKQKENQETKEMLELLKAMDLLEEINKVEI